MEPKSVQRQVYLDWLRVLGVLAVFVYHTTRLFNPEDWHVKNPITYQWLDYWNGFATTWLMPLLFVVSGISLFYAVAKSGAARFWKDKALRLLVPLLVGMFTHASLQVYLERLTHGQFSGTYFQFLPHYFEGFYEGYPATGNFPLTGMHLWYLFWLFLLTLVLYPLLRWLQGRGRKVLDRLGQALARPAAVYLLALPVILLALDNPGDPFFQWEAGWNVLAYLWLILCGFLLASSGPLLDGVQRLRWVSLAAAVITVAVSLWSYYYPEAPAYGTAWNTLAFALRGLSAFCWVLAFLGLGRAFLVRSTPFLKYANEAVLPFYILHQTVILGVGYFVVQWAVPDPVKWAIVLVLSFALIVALYDLLVRRLNVLRVLFGLKRRARAPAAQPTLAARAAG